MASYPLEQFVEDLRAAAASAAAARDVVDRAAPLVRRFAEEGGWLGPESRETDPEQGFGIRVLHEEPDHSLLVESIAWAPGRGVKPHDHQTWGIVVGVEGVERNVNWERVDDGSEPGRAELRQRNVIDVGPGHLCAFMPNDIHSVENVGDTVSVSLHVYGRSLAHIDRSEFDPEEGTVRPCPKRKRVQA